MTSSPNALHVYVRDIDMSQTTSLSILVAQIATGSDVLDLGTGSGALGRHLTEHANCVVDGVTYNAAEAELARPAYRQLEIADLDTCDLAGLFGTAQYDYIVCADVLEHLKQPERILTECMKRLRPSGKLLISVPNIAYGGLLAELLMGEFRYREEGLLDRTHLRFFTRQSLTRFLEDQGWALDTVQTVDIDLHTSEFGAAFDSLPPAVARYLLALPDCLSYQFIVSASTTPLATGDTAHIKPPAAASHSAKFSAQLYLADETGYAEHRKIVVPGDIGNPRQTLRFPLPSESCSSLTALRLDPADRPGFVHLYAIRLIDTAGKVQWQWDGKPASLADSTHSQMVFQTPWFSPDAALLLLTGDDPQLELPISASALAACAQGACLEIELGWPMSADYLAMAGIADAFEARLAKQSSETASITAALSDARTQHQHSAALAQERSEKIDHLSTELERQKAAAAALAAQKLALERERDERIRYLQAIENSTIFRMTRPLVRAKMFVDGLIRPGVEATPPHAAQRRPMAPSVHPVDVIVPVYKGLNDTRCCIESVLSSNCAHPFRLIVINDASPDAEVRDYLKHIDGSDERLIVLENDANLGFVATVNRGMSFSTDNDVILLNSDAEVANDWLDRLRVAAYADERVASVTPFSNNATICSYPNFCQDNDLPAGYDTAALDRLFAQTNAGKLVEIPTAIGFCMYIRRDCLNTVGLFDVENFGKGYGEENDFCMRAIEAGWHNLFALDTFVRHAGGVSFGSTKTPREREAGAVMRRLHPEYETIVHAHIAADPARSARLAIDIARIHASAHPVILAVTHDRAGGTLRHIRELAHHFDARAVFFSLSPAPGGETLLQRLGDGEAFQLSFRLPEEFDALVDTLRHIGVGHVHFHHLLGHSPDITTLPERLSVAYDFTAHDFYSLCPQVSLIDHTNRYCGEKGIEQCTRCLQKSPAPDGVDIETWRERYRTLLSGARNVIAPSHDTAQRLRTLAPVANIRVVPHGDIEHTTAVSPAPQQIEATAPLRIAVIGALSPIKGADVLEEVATEAARQGAALEFHLIGYAYRSLRTQPRSRLTVHGQYEEEDLPRLLDWLKPDLVWFPAQCPETYSYTLSACLHYALPVVATTLGAFPERLSGRAWSWIRPWNLSAAEWLAFFDNIREHHFVTGEAPAVDTRTSPEQVEWSYDRAYLDGISQVREHPPLPEGALEYYRAGRHTGMAAVRSGLKQTALQVIIRLRSTALLRGLARRIPLRWQSRLKSWLLR